MTTELAEKPEKETTVLVLCDGIAVDTGFNMAPDGISPSFVNFTPGKPSEMAKEYADYLISQDPHKFTIVKASKKAAADEKTTDTTDADANSPEAKKAAREAIRAAREAAQKKKDDATAARKAAKEAAKAATAK